MPWNGSLAAYREHLNAVRRAKAKPKKKTCKARTGLVMTSKADYRKYLASKWWKGKRKQKLASVGYKCEKCACTDSIQVHHKHYRTLGRERNTDLEVLCGICHQDAHPGWVNEPLNDHMRSLVASAILGSV